MAIATIVVLALLARKGLNHANASPIPNERESRPCTSFSVPVPITAQNYIYDIVPVNSNMDAVHFAQDLDTWDNPSFADRILQNITISKTYDIHMQLCVPPNGGTTSSLQIATHGGGFDSRYWDPKIEPEQHSFVNAALNAGYSVLTYDRLGTGQSSKPSAYTDVQAPSEVEVLRVVSEMVRNGTISSPSISASNDGMAFEKIIHVGHSYGSFVTYALTALYPSLSDAAVLTGFILDKELFNSRQTAMGLEYALESDPALFADSSSGYIAQGTQSAFQTGFFSSRVNETTGIGGFDPELLAYAHSIRQPQPAPQMGSATVMFADVPYAPHYSGPVQLMLGVFDLIICLGDCRNTYNSTRVQEMFPNSPNVDINLQPGTGHGLPFHNGAQLGFQATFEWLDKNGF